MSKILLVLVSTRSAMGEHLVSPTRCGDSSQTSPTGLTGQRMSDSAQVALEQWLKDAIARLNPAIPREALETFPSSLL